MGHLYDRNSEAIHGYSWLRPASDGQLSLSTSTKPTALAKGLFLGNRGWHTSPVAVGS